MFIILSEGGDDELESYEQLRILWSAEISGLLNLRELLISTVSSLSYLIAISRFLFDTHEVKNNVSLTILSKLAEVKTKQLRCLAYFLVIFAIDVIFTVHGWEIYANYIFLAVTSVILGKVMIGNRLGSGGIKELRYYLFGFSFALTIFVSFQWIVALVGSIAFIMFPYSHLVDNPAFVITLLAAHIGVAGLLRKYSYLVFRPDASIKLILIDIGAKVFFIAFFNIIFPRYFGLLGMENYSVLSIVLLATFLMFAVYREYSISLEKQIAVYNNNQLAIMQWAARTIAKHEGLRLKELKRLGKSKKLKIMDAPDETKGLNMVKGFEKFLEAIHSVENPIMQALLYEFAFTAEKFGICIEISIKSANDKRGVNDVTNDVDAANGTEATKDMNLSNNRISSINLNNYDLYGIVNSLMENALHIAKSQINKSICISIDGSDGFKLAIQTKTGTELSKVQNCESPECPCLGVHVKLPKKFLMNFGTEKDTAIKWMEKRSNVTIDISREGGFTQTVWIG